MALLELSEKIYVKTLETKKPVDSISELESLKAFYGELLGSFIGEVLCL